VIEIVGDDNTSPSTPSTPYAIPELNPPTPYSETHPSVSKRVKGDYIQWDILPNAPFLDLKLICQPPGVKLEEINTFAVEAEENPARIYIVDTGADSTHGASIHLLRLIDKRC
jgi:hypothetical protein